MTEPEPSRGQIDLRRPRDLGALVVDGFRLYFRAFPTFLLITIAVVVPVQVIVGGFGLGQFTAEYDRASDPAEAGIAFASGVLVILPLVTAMCTYALLDIADGRKPRARSAIQRGLDVFAPLLGAAVLYVAGVALGLLALVLPGLYLAVRWVLYIQAVVIDGRRGFQALERSGELVRGSWFRVAAVYLASQLLVGALGSVLGAPFLAAAEATDDAVWQLAGQTVSGVLATAPAALIMSLLYFDQRARTGL